MGERIARLGVAKPGRIAVTHEKRPILIFTDGASELKGHHWGIAFIDEVSKIKFVSGGEEPGKLVDAWQRQAGASIINQVELYPIVLIRRALAQRRR
eukprot:5403325-Amphidinium_carterae.1